MGKFPTITAGALTTTDYSVSIATGVPFVLGRAAVGQNDAVTKHELDSLQSIVDNMLAGSNDAYNSFNEIKTFVDDCNAAGVTNLTAAVAAEAATRSAEAAAEASAREAGDVAEALARSAADAAEALARSAADAAEAALRNDADELLHEKVAAEAAAREAGVAAEAALREAGDVAGAALREAGDVAEAALRAEADELLHQTIFKQICAPLSTAVVPDESPPIVMPKAILNMCSMDGWYFKNQGPSSAARKINWYLQSPLNSNGVATYKSLLEVGILVKLLNRQSPPFLTIYTKLKASGNSATWYNAKHTYILDNSVLTDVPVNENNFLLAVAVNRTSVGKFSGFRKVELTKDDYSSRGSILPDDEILAMSVGTDSSTAAGNVEMVLHKVNYFSENDNYGISFSNSDVLQKFLVNKVDELYTSLGQTLPSSEIGW